MTDSGKAKSSIGRGKALSGRSRHWRNLIAKLHRKQAGFTLLEVVVALALASIIMVPLLGALSTGFINQHHVSDRLTLLNLARQQLEYIENQPFQETPASYVIIPSVPEWASIQVQVTVPVQYTYADPGATPTPEVVQLITVTVSTEGDTVFLGGYKVRQ